MFNLLNACGRVTKVLKKSRLSFSRRALTRKSVPFRAQPAALLDIIALEPMIIMSISSWGMHE
jgi:hypothetical protein